VVHQALRVVERTPRHTDPLEQFGAIVALALKVRQQKRRIPRGGFQSSGSRQGHDVQLAHGLRHTRLVLPLA